MASSVPLFVLTILIGILSISATARPCKTLFFASYSFSFSFPNPNPNEPATTTTGIVTSFPNPNKSSYVTVFPDFPHRQPSDGFLSPHFDQFHEISSTGISLTEIFPDDDNSAKGNDDLASFRDRTKDILSVVVGLLFGVGCGALTAATMYMIWSLFSIRSRYSDSFDDEIYDDEQFSPTKVGYVKIPSDAATPAPAEKTTA